MGATLGRGGIGLANPASASANAIFFPCRCAEATIDWIILRFVPVVGLRRLLVCAARTVDTDAADDTPPRPSMVTSPSSPF